jgi:signal transduction histidine kinase
MSLVVLVKYKPQSMSTPILINENDPTRHFSSPIGNNIGDKSTDSYGLLLEAIKQVEHYSLDPFGVIIGTNLETSNVTGYDEHEVLGRHFSLFYGGDEKDKCQVDLDKACKLGKALITGPKLKKKNALFWAKISIVTVFDGSRKLVGFHATIRENAHRALANFRIRAMRDEYFSIFNNPFIGSFKFRMSDFSLMLFNGKAQQITGVSNYASARFNQFFRPDQFENLISVLRQRGRVENFEFELMQHSGAGRSKWCQVCCRFFPLQGFVEGILIDNTEKRDQLEALEKVNAELDQFIYHASHDLRAPLTTILGLSNLMKIDNDLNNIREYNQHLEQRIIHLDELLANLGVIAQSNVKPIVGLPINLEDVKRQLAAEFDNNKFNVEVRFSFQQRHSFYNDEARLLTIIRKVLYNSLHFRDPGKGNCFVDLQCRVNEDSTLSIVCTDNGIGIGKRHKNKIFEMFYRGTVSSKGSGLGLYIVKTVVDRMLGTIEVESELYLGTSIKIRLPSLPHRNVGVN